MNRIIRGRIRDGQWVDQQVLWQADLETYTDTSDLAAGGRLAFDDKGHVFFSVGMKAPLEFLGIQDLNLPYGKIHRINDDGSIPADNPFVNTPGALQSIWTYGHRSVQGLEWDARSRVAWSTEMGPRGGDELNRLQPGRNYGWPLFTSGVNYDGRPVDVSRALGISLDAKDVEFPVLDVTPAQALSSFVFYEGKGFRKWRGNIILGTLRATDVTWRASATSPWAARGRSTCCWRTPQAPASCVSFPRAEIAARCRPAVLNFYYRRYRKS
jgi:glucose/arabinose dehydrogenase